MNILWQMRLGLQSLETAATPHLGPNVRAHRADEMTDATTSDASEAPRGASC